MNTKWLNYLHSIVVVLFVAVQPLCSSIIQTNKQGKKTLVIGTTIPKTGEAGIIGRGLDYGMSLRINQQNRDYGGINDLEISLDIRDDANVAVTAKKNIADLIEQSPLLLGVFGSRALRGVKNDILAKKMLMMFPIVGSSQMRTAEYENLVFYRAPTLAEIEKLIAYSVDTLQKEKIAIFYEDSKSGKNAFNHAQELLRKRGIDYNVSSSYPRGTVNITSAVEDIAKKAPDAILCIAHARPTYYFIRQIVNKGLHKTTFLGTSRLATIQNVLRTSRGIKSIITTSVVPDPRKSELEIAREYRENMKKFLPNISLSSISFEGYINASILVHCLEQIKGVITPERLLTKVEGLKDETFKGIHLDFNSETRTLSSNVWINTGDKDQPWQLANHTKDPDDDVVEEEEIDKDDDEELEDDLDEEDEIDFDDDDSDDFEEGDDD